ncbi:acyl-CoA dehydrogenase family protein [Rhodococcus sp. NPDC127530]|uniref:acyl-CoA dehydrogenase family protein n=1 Tax=unclassified Rhodococcus (in: high G+C Gram-positive bacteria) TaxID=192944 RepID=UPI003643B08E
MVTDTDTDSAEDLHTEAGWDAWLRNRFHDMAAFRATPGDDLDTRIEKGAGLLGYLNEHGAAGSGWPIEVGGLGGSAVDRAVFYDVITRHGFGMPESAAVTEVMGSALVKFAPVLASAYFPDLLAGRSLWCQGFSEPEAGSDLASLRTTARKVDGGWRLSGQKVWTSLGHRSDWCGVLARTGAPDSRHRGLTLFWMDMRAVGVQARPLESLTGEDDFSELFLDSVFVPDGHVVGDVDAGWAIAMYLLQYERGMWAWQRQSIMHAMLQEAADRVDDPQRVADIIAPAYSALAAVRLRSRSTVRRLAAGEPLGPEVSADKVLLGHAEHVVNDAVRRLTPHFETSDAAEVSSVRREWFYSREATVYGGAVDIQRNIIAQRVLGLPREGHRG